LNNSSAQKAYTDTAWFADLRSLSAALSKGDLARVKRWFKFPIMNAGNEIWIFTDTDENVQRDTALVPFTEHDFDARYVKLFPLELIRGLEKVRLDSLVPGMADDLELGGSDSLRYSLLTYVDAANTEFSLVLNSTYIPLVGKKRDEEEVMESSVVYIFDIRDGRRLMFRELRMAD